MCVYEAPGKRIRVTEEKERRKLTTGWNIFQEISSNDFLSQLLLSNGLSQLCYLSISQTDLASLSFGGVYLCKQISSSGWRAFGEFANGRSTNSPDNGPLCSQTRKQKQARQSNFFAYTSKLTPYFMLPFAPVSCLCTITRQMMHLWYTHIPQQLLHPFQKRREFKPFQHLFSLLSSVLILLLRTLAQLTMMEHLSALLTTQQQRQRVHWHHQPQKRGETNTQQ